jgi:hypothetical protein
VRYTALDGVEWTIHDVIFARGAYHRRAHGAPDATRRIFVNAEGVKRSYTLGVNEPRAAPFQRAVESVPVSALTMWTLWTFRVLVLSALAACAPPYQPPAPSGARAPTEVLTSFGRTWDGVIDVFAEENIPISTMERASRVHRCPASDRARPPGCG